MSNEKYTLVRIFQSDSDLKQQGVLTSWFHLPVEAAGFFNVPVMITSRVDAYVVCAVTYVRARMYVCAGVPKHTYMRVVRASFMIICEFRYSRRALINRNNTKVRR